MRETIIEAVYTLNEDYRRFSFPTVIISESLSWMLGIASECKIQGKFRKYEKSRRF